MVRWAAGQRSCSSFESCTSLRHPSVFFEECFHFGLQFFRELHFIEALQVQSERA